MYVSDHCEYPSALCWSVTQSTLVKSSYDSRPWHSHIFSKHIKNYKNHIHNLLLPLYLFRVCVGVCMCVFVNRYPDVDRRGVQCAAAGRTDWGEQNKPKHVQTYTTYVTLSATHIRVYVKWHVRFVFEGCRSHFANVLLALHFSLDLFRCLPSNSTE